jgi:hypothetical protein
LRRCEAAEAPAEASSANFFSCDKFGFARRIERTRASLSALNQKRTSKNRRVGRRQRNPHFMGTFAPCRIFRRRLSRRESFRKGVLVSIAQRARRGGANRNLYTKLSGKDVFSLLVV